MKEYLRPSWSSHAGVYFIKVPEGVLDEKMTVVGLSLNGKLETGITACDYEKICSGAFV
ncbi:MAG: hypothetical protein MZV63_31220 [Marinilabiliales bacterium]|nr:hypothetical protein [Marinilabiliales bacterium]